MSDNEATCALLPSHLLVARASLETCGIFIYVFFFCPCPRFAIYISAIDWRNSFFSAKRYRRDDVSRVRRVEIVSRQDYDSTHRD